MKHWLLKCKAMLPSDYQVICTKSEPQIIGMWIVWMHLSFIYMSNHTYIASLPNASALTDWLEIGAKFKNSKIYIRTKRISMIFHVLHNFIWQRGMLHHFTSLAEKCNIGHSHWGEKFPERCVLRNNVTCHQLCNKHEIITFTASSLMLYV